MRITSVLPVTLLVLVTAIAISDGFAAAPPSPAEVAAQRQKQLDAMLTTDTSSDIASQRRLSASGGAPASVNKSRADGAFFLPDAADSCITALVRTAHDHRLPNLYSKLLAELGGSGDAAEQLPRAIGTAVLGNATKVSIGNGKVAVVTPALAFDAGFAAAYQAGDASKARAGDTAQLKAVAEGCLGQHEDAGTCFSVGYVYGGRTLVAAR